MPKTLFFSNRSFLRNFAPIFAKLISQNCLLHFAKFRETRHSKQYSLLNKSCKLAHWHLDLIRWYKIQTKIYFCTWECQKLGLVSNLIASLRQKCPSVTCQLKNHFSATTWIKVILVIKHIDENLSPFPILKGSSHSVWDPTSAVLQRLLLISFFF